MDDIQADVQFTAQERVDYPTQKPEGLLERIISASAAMKATSWPTSSAAAARPLQLRKSSAENGSSLISASSRIHTTRKRLIQVQRERKAKDETFRAFEVLNLGRYERQVYLNVSGRLTGRRRSRRSHARSRSSGI